MRNALLSFTFASIALTHFLWYMNVLGGSLATKVGEYRVPAWSSFLPCPLAGSGLLMGLWMVFRRRGIEAIPSK